VLSFLLTYTILLSIPTAHPIHLHLVNFEIVSDYTFSYTVAQEEQITSGHMGTTGVAPKIDSISDFTFVPRNDEFYADAPKDMVVVLPGRGTLIRATFPKAGSFVWHCHILSHEDHEMMRIFEVVDSGDKDFPDMDDDDDKNYPDMDHDDSGDGSKDYPDYSPSDDHGILHPFFSCDCSCEEGRCICSCESTGLLDDSHVERTWTHTH